MCPLLIAESAFRIVVALKIAILARVRINDTANGAMFGGDFRLNPAPGAAVARDNNSALHLDPVPGEHFVILGHSVIDVDQFAGDVAVDRISVIDGQHVGSLRGS